MHPRHRRTDSRRKSPTTSSATCTTKAWSSLLCCTPPLFPIYCRAGRRGTGTYPPALQRRIGWERRGTIAFHVAVMAAIVLLGGWGVLARVFLVPYFLVFPIAFAL